MTSFTILFSQLSSASLHFTCRKNHSNLYRQTVQIEALIEIEEQIAEFSQQLMVQIARSPNQNSAELSQMWKDLEVLKETSLDLSEQVLSDPDLTTPNTIDLLSQNIRDLKGRLLSYQQNSEKGAQRDAHSFSELMGAPQTVKADFIYQLEPSIDSQGNQRKEQRSVQFSQEIVDFFSERPGSPQFFFRAIQQGYVGPFSGAGIMRISDVHPDLIEVKWPNGPEGNYRLMGCRHKAGHLIIKKVYFKRNSGHSGSLAIFRNLCS